MRIIKHIRQRSAYMKRTTNISYSRIALKFHCVKGSQCYMQKYHLTFIKKVRTFWVRELCLFNGCVGRVAWGLHR